MAKHYALATSGRANGSKEHHVTVADDQTIRDAIAHVDRCAGAIVGWGVASDHPEPHNYQDGHDLTTGECTPCMF